MAKQKRSLFELSGTLGGITFVQTRKGTVVRSARGTVKEAVCNDSLQEQNHLNYLVNPAARLVNGFVKVYALSFKKSDLWQDMQSRMRKSGENNFAGVLQSLEGMEVNPKYPLGRIMPDAQVRVELAQGIVTLEVHYTCVFFNAVQADCYCYELVVLFANEECTLIDRVQINSGWLGLKDARENNATSFEMPVGAAYYVVLMKVEGGRKGIAIEEKPAMGVRVMKTGADADSNAEP